MHWAYRHHSAVYFTGLGFISAAFIFLVLWLGLLSHAPGIQMIIVALLLVPVSQLALEGVNYLVLRLLPPRTLPKMDFRASGIPDACRTLVVIPMMLVDQETIKAEAEKLEIRLSGQQRGESAFWPVFGLQGCGPGPL